MNPAPRILLVVTGDLEQAALAAALRQIFPQVEFATKQTQGFTSTTLLEPDPELPPQKTAKTEDLADKLLGAALPTRPGDPPFDYAIAFEDVELANEPASGPPDVGVQRILGHFALGIDRCLRRHAAAQAGPVVLPKGKAGRYVPPPSTDAERRRFLRERCSFHLFRPMPESLFFGDPMGVVNAAGAGATLPPIHFDPGTCDVESFQTADPGYLSPVDQWQPPGCTGSAPWAKARRERHPKHYLQYLLDPSGTRLHAYREKDHGARALKGLDWQSVVAHSRFAQMVRALLDDVADMTGTSLPWMAGQLHPLTCRKKDGLLRNLARPGARP